jgi:ATP-dependent protease ClpP protease subunit
MSKTTEEVKISADALHLEHAFEGFNRRNRVIQITGDIEWPQFDFLDTSLTELEKESRKGITIRINSFGGCPWEAMAMVGRIKKSHCHITTEGYGAIMSAACVILASGDKRRISQYAWYMWHEASYYVEGNHSQNKARIIQGEREEDQWAQVMHSFSNESIQFWRKNGTGIDAYFTAQELADLGVVDEIF